MPSDSISEGLTFQNFLGDMPPDPQNLVLLNQIYINCFAICMRSWKSRNNKPLKMPSDSISEGLIFQNFLGVMPPDPLDLAFSACQNMCFAHNCHVHHIVPVPPPFVNPGSAPETDNQLCVALYTYYAVEGWHF